MNLPRHDEQVSPGVTEPGQSMANRLDERPLVVSMWCLGRLGKFGNQLIQYAFLRIYAHRHGLATMTPKWVGQKIYGFADPAPTRLRAPVVDAWIPRYARRREFGVFALLHLLRWMRESWREEIDWVEFDHEILSNDSAPLVDVEFWGTCLFPTRTYFAHQSFFRSLFQPLPEIEAKVRPMLDALRRSGRTVVGIQIRLGDFWQYVDCNWAFIAPTSWYVEWLDGIWDDLADPVLLVCSDEPERIRDDFARFDPVTSADIDADVCREMTDAGYGFFPDFYLLGHCDVLGVSASSFALVPAMLNDRCQRFFRPDARAGRLVSFDPWNTTVYADSVEEERMSSLAGRVRYRWDNIRRMGEAHGYATLLRRSIPRLHRRVSYELGAVLVSWFIQSMRLLNRLLRRRFGRTLSPLDVFSTDWLIGFFTRKFNR
jgi:hypothetical protein